jgi:hypothetical protein
VCDCYTHALHVLSEQGDILTCKVMEDTGIKYPISLDIDMRGQLWVGCDTECPVYVHLKPPSLPTTTTLPVSSDVLSTTTMSLLLFVVILYGKVNSLCLLLF